MTPPFYESLRARTARKVGKSFDQLASGQVESGRSIDKWKLYRALCEARTPLDVTDRALAVLNALLSFHPKNDLTEEGGLVVFPSNAQLSLRAHGMAEQTIRRHLAALVAAGLILRKDSPNGKRYARKDRGGDIQEAFGFSLAPLLARCEEIEALAAQVIAGRLHLQRLRERLTLCRRDIVKLVEAALEEGIVGDWDAILCYQRSLVARLRRVATTTEVLDVLEDMDILRDEVINRLQIRVKSQILSGNAVIASGTYRIQNQTPLLSLNLASNRSRGRSRVIVPQRLRANRRTRNAGIAIKAAV